ncbi:MAG TPA: glycosyltransferase family A protein [Azospirillaceae bacterium]|nr:glycosyltransferase family A protein [Azospirillaceae bacterium]
MHGPSPAARIGESAAPALPVPVTAVVVSRGGAPDLADTLASLLAQTRPPESVIVVDEGLCDDAARVAARFRVRCFHLGPLGPADARDRGLEAVRTPYVLFLEPGDVLPAGLLAEGVERLARTGTDLAVLGCAMPGNPTANPVLYRADALRRLGGCAFFRGGGAPVSTVSG